MKTIRPFSQKNAVKIVAFGINFSETISEIETVIDNLKEDKNFEDFVSNVPEEITTVISPNNITQQRINKAGIIFQNNDCYINLSKNMLIINFKNYTNWTEISNKVFTYIKNILIYVKNSINQITLEYLDEFEILDINEDWKNKLFVRNSKYINNSINEIDDFWHINQGRYLKLDGIESKVLDTINIKFFADHNDGLKNKVNLLCQHRVAFQEHQNYGDKIEYSFDVLHAHAKDVFQNIINENMIENFTKEDKK